MLFFMGREGPLRKLSAMDFVIHEHPDHLHVVAGGEFDFEVCKGVVDEVARRCKDGGASRVLIDGRGIPVQVSIAARFNLAEYLAAAIPPTVRVAFLVSTMHVNFTKTLENTANNRGALVMTTDSMQAAQSFLGIDAGQRKVTG
jgi:hypothetical protein